jgi:uncharacterized protein
MLGCDTVYARGWSDDEIVRVARTEQRIVITRDRALAARAERAVLLGGVDLPGQLRQVLTLLPEIPHRVTFERCTLCNGELRPVGPSPGPTPEGAEPGAAPGTTVFACGSCGHRYWEGSHTADVRRHLIEWAPGTTS